MRVLAVGNFYPPHDQGGGYEAVWHSATEHLRSRGNEVRILASDHRDADGPPDEDHVFRELQWYWRDYGYPRISLLETLSIERHNKRCFARHVEDFVPDVVAWWSMGGMSMGLLEQARRAGLPAVAFVHDDWLDYGRRTDAWHRRIRRRRITTAAERVTGLPAQVDFAAAARYAFVSERTHTHAERSGLSLPDWTVAHSGIAQSLYRPAPDRAWGGRLLYVGRVDPRKGVETPIRALRELPDATLDVAGDTPAEERAALEGLAGELGVAERLRLLGVRTPAQVHELYGESDAVVFPVLWEEPWGLVPLEAMARGRPVLATGRGGSADYLRDEANCLLFEAGDAKSLAAAVNRLTADPELRATLRRNGLETAAAHSEHDFNLRVEEELLAVGSGA